MRLTSSQRSCSSRGGVWTRCRRATRGGCGCTYGVARGVLANHHRSAQRRNRLGERLRHELGGALEPGIALAREDVDGVTVRTAVRRLPESDRELLRLTAWEGLAPNEAATDLQISAGAARVRLHRARVRLRRELQVLGWSSRHDDGEPVLTRTNEETT